MITAFLLSIAAQVLALGCFLLLPAWGIYLVGNGLNRVYIRAIGCRRAIFLSGWLGAPVHEMSHALVAWLFRFRIERVSLFSPNAVDGSLGSVSNIPQGRPLLRETGVFLTALAPYFGGSLVLYLLLRLFVPESGILFSGVQEILASSSPSLFKTVAALFAAFLGNAGFLLGRLHLTDWRHLLFLYLSFAIIAHMAPSPQDFSHCRRGMVVSAMTLLAVVVINAFIFMNRPDALPAGLKNLLTGPVTLLMMSLTMGLMLLSTSWLIFGIIRRVRRRKCS